MTPACSMPRRANRCAPKLAALEARSGIQLVVATVKSLNGNAIEDYANRLFRRWQLGQKGKNNGVLLLHAPAERKVRIEVGYGLEGTLTDAATKYIITNSITPRFKANDFSGGMTRGVDDILKVLSGDEEFKQRIAAPAHNLELVAMIPPTVVFIFMAIVLFIIGMPAIVGLASTPAQRLERRRDWSQQRLAPLQFGRLVLVMEFVVVFEQFERQLLGRRRRFGRRWFVRRLVRGSHDF